MFLCVIIIMSPAGFRYLVTHLMGPDLNNIVKNQSLGNDHVKLIVYQILRGLKVGGQITRQH